jgi:hypothetical protein
MQLPILGVQLLLVCCCIAGAAAKCPFAHLANGGVGMGSSSVIRTLLGKNEPRVSTLASMPSTAMQACACAMLLGVQRVYRLRLHALRGTERSIKTMRGEALVQQATSSGSHCVLTIVLIVPQLHAPAGRCCSSAGPQHLCS